MALMMGSLYDALRSASVDDEKARKAAEEVADYQNQNGKIRADVVVLRWMTGIAVSGILALLVRSFAS